MMRMPWALWLVAGSDGSAAPWTAEALAAEQNVEISTAGQYTGQVLPPPTREYFASCGAQSLPEEPRKFDLVITFFTDRPQSEVTSVPPAAAAGPAASFLRTGEASSSQMENYMEIVYELRSFEKFGLLDFVRRVYVIMDERRLAQFGAPRTLNFAAGQSPSGLELRLVTDAELGISDHQRSPKWASLHKLPGILDFFLYFPDDDLLRKEFSLADFWDEPHARPILSSYGSWEAGWCNGGQGVGSGHGPALFNKCYLSKVGEYYSSPAALPFNWAENEVKDMGDHNLDATCLYTQAVCLAGLASWGGTLPQWYMECHLNGGCAADTLLETLKRSPAKIINLQGNGVSDDYGGTDNEQAKQVYVQIGGTEPMSLEIGGSNLRQAHA